MIKNNGAQRRNSPARRFSINEPKSPGDNDSIVRENNLHIPEVSILRDKELGWTRVTITCSGCNEEIFDEVFSKKEINIGHKNYCPYCGARLRDIESRELEIHAIKVECPTCGEFTDKFMLTNHGRRTYASHCSCCKEPLMDVYTYMRRITGLELGLPDL